MRWLTSLLVLLMLAVAAALTVRHVDGYVLVVSASHRIEFSLALLIVAGCAALAITYALLRGLINLWNLPRRVRDFRLHRRRTRARGALQQATSALFEGQHARAERSGALAMRLQDAAPLGAAIAARAAHAQGKYAQRDQYLAQASIADDNAKLLIAMTRAELLCDERQYAVALDALAWVRRQHPRHVPALRLELRCQAALGNINETSTLARQLQELSASDARLAQDYLLQAQQETARRASETPLHAVDTKAPETETPIPKAAPN